jgi:hypothetical protein
MREESRVIVKVINFQPLLEKTLSEKQKAFQLLSEAGLSEADKYKVFQDIGKLTCDSFAYVQTSKGMYALSTEGIGSEKPINESNKLVVPVRPLHILNMTVEILEFSNIQLAKMPIAYEVPLRKFIRQFGNRLENNYIAWKSILEAAI